jgi:heptaprenyl diphosphate synthase
VEILHLATLLHDDVIDDAKTRRGLPTVQKKFGKKTAVIAGDLLFCRCFSLVAELSRL